MSDLFTKGKARVKKGSFSVAAAGGADLVKRLRRLENGGEVAIQRTVSDFATRAPAWVSKGVRQHYGVDAETIKAAARKPKRGKSAATVKVAGQIADGAALVYSGRLLTPTHFKMKPATRPPGGKKYVVSAAIIKGTHKPLTPKGPKAFLAPATKKREDATIIPWQRVGDGRLPVHVIKAISVPQMTGGLGGDGKEHESLAHESIRQELDKGLDKRFEHHIKQAMK